ncbi:MAG: AmmeMemoRadiSam system radical SAM enzyme [Candidatus Glassbacteria bacterium]|nr:AmmeMemoRadiSam system radical SAM enzyme [Candidatus Glassbacteria bacterium]
MREAGYYQALDGGGVECGLCPHRCRIAPGERGVCRVRENRDGKLYSLVYGRLAASHVDPIEKKPLFHFLPGSLAYSVSTVGCNLSCPFCQNHEISLVMRTGIESPPGYDAPVERVADEAVASGCHSLCFTYTEPTIFFEYMADLAAAARARGIRSAIVSNGFIETEPLAELCGLIDAANIDLKAFNPDTYRKVLKGRLEPVLETIRTLHSAGVWTEVTTLVVPEMNDSGGELGQIAEFIASLDRDIPWHVSRFFPHSSYTARDITPHDSIRRALDAGREAGLRYVYAGNLPGDESESTFCPSCGQTVIERRGYSVAAGNLVDANHCANCNSVIAGVF